MRFKEWLLNEIQHISLPEKMKINGILTDAIDFRFEDWSQGFQNQDQIRLPLSNPRQFFQGSFSAPLHNGTFLNVIQGSQATQSGNLALALDTEQQVVINSQPVAKVLPKQWSNFAVFYLGNRVVKKPEWPRDDYEKI